MDSPKKGLTNELIRAIQKKDDKEVTKLLVTMDVNAKDEYGLTPLHHACDVNNTNAVTQLLSIPGIKINTRDNNGQTPLHYVRVNNNSESDLDNASTASFPSSASFVPQLLAFPGVKVNPKDNDGYTPLHYACLVNNSQAVSQLLAAQGIEVNTRSNSGSASTPIMSSAARCHSEAVRIMLDHPQVDIAGLEEFVGRWGGTVAAKNQCLQLIEAARRKRQSF